MSEPTLAATLHAPALDPAILEADPLSGDVAPDATEEPTRITWKWSSIPFVLSHLAALGIFFVPFEWSLVALCLGLYLVKMFGITGGYHRYFSHRTFKTSRAFQYVLAVLGGLSLQRGALWWAAHHRHHHRHSDRYGDLHSPGLQGFLHAHVGWILDAANNDTDYERVGDLSRYPELVWLNRWHVLPGVLLAIALFAIGGLPWLLWGFFFSTVLTWHATFAINSLTHLFGRRRFLTKDDSRNNVWLALLTLGEGWHNNHHYWKSSTRQGFFWWEIDVTYYVLRLLAALGIVWELREPPAELVAVPAGEGGALLDPLGQARRP